MAIYDLVITDVTRYGTLFCVAGWDLNNGGMIRPEPPTANVGVEASRFWGVADAGPDKLFAVGNIVRIDAIPAPANFPFPHATEDRIFVQGSNPTIMRQISQVQIAQSVAKGLSATLYETFGGHLQRALSGKVHVAAGQRTRSLDATEIVPRAISFYEDNPSPGKRQLRVVITQNGTSYDLSVPADAARTRFLGGGIAALEADAKASQRIHVRLGLSRPFSAMPNSCYAQVNGLYFL